MNFQIARAVSLLSDGSAFVYPETDGVHLFRREAGGTVTHRVHPLPATMRILTLLHLQGVSVDQTERAQNFIPWYLLKNYGVILPAPYEKKVRIGRVVFDSVWNRGNELHFLKFIWSNVEGRDGKVLLEELRDLMELAVGREGFAELYHRSVAVVTNVDMVAERLQSEAGHKIRVFNTARNEQTVMAAFSEFLAGKPRQPVEATAEKVAISARLAGDGGALVVSLGKNIMPTLVAIWSHRPARLLLLHTPGDEIIDGYRRSLADNLDLLPAGLASLEFHPVSISGCEILAFPSPEATVTVNISPGTKGQAAFLSLWARMHGAAIASIRTNPPAIGFLDREGELPVSAPEPAGYLRLSGVPVSSLGKTSADYGDAEREKLLVKFLAALRDAGVPIDYFPRRRLVVPGFLFQPAGENVELRHGKQTVVWNPKGGEWFEDLVGYALLTCGADDVQVRIRTSWPEEIESRLRQKHGCDEVFKSDLDVVARLGGDYLLVSCKAFSDADHEQTARQAVTHAHLFGRFCLPFVCNLYHEDAPVMTTAGAPLFGWRTLIDRSAMSDLIYERLAAVRKTGS